MDWPTIYWLGYASVAVAVLGLSVTCWLRKRGKEINPFWFLFLYAALLVLGRWRSIVFPGELNPDESLMLAQAMKFRIDAMPWRSVDTGTGGPIDSYVLLLFHYLGLPFGYLLARIAAAACLLAYLSFLFLAFRRMASMRVAVLCVTPLALFHAAPVSGDFLHYSSELASMAEIGFMCWLISGFDVGGSRIQVVRAASVGAVGVVIALSKMQALPVAAVVGISLVWLRSEKPNLVVARLGTSALSACVFIALIVAGLIYAGVGEDLRVSFIDLPRTYAATPFSFRETIKFLVMIEDTRDFTIITTVLISVTAVFALWKSNIQDALFYVLAPAMLVAVGTYVAIAQPGRGFPHYLNYFALGAIAILFIVGRGTETHANG